MRAADEVERRTIVGFPSMERVSRSGQISGRHDRASRDE
jgi:hypothetical protein